MSDHNQIWVCVMVAAGSLALAIIATKVDRCADSLERIADALEGKEPDEEQDDDFEQ